MSAVFEVRFDDAVLADPYPTYARLRQTEGLAQHSRERYFLVARYEDVREAAMRTEDFSSRIVDVLVRSTGLGPLFQAGMDWLGPVDVLAVVDAPVHLAQRKLATRHFAREPVADVIDRTELAAGDRLMLLWASANRDPSVFEAPDELRLDRKTKQLAFGQGVHLCLGAGLARAATRVVLERFLAMTSGIELAAERVEHKPSGFVRTLVALPLRVRAA